MAQSADILSQWPRLGFLEGVDSYFKDDVENNEDFSCIYDLMKGIVGPLTYQAVIDEVSKKHDYLHEGWADYICVQLQYGGLELAKVDKMFATLSAMCPPETRKKPRKDRLSSIEPRAFKKWTDRRIRSLVDCVKDVDQRQRPAEVSLVIKNDGDKRLVKAFEEIQLGQIIKLEGDANIVSKVKNRIPNGIAVTQNVKQILDFLVTHVQSRESGSLYVVGPSGCSKTVATALCGTYCQVKNVFHICLWDTQNLAKGEDEEAAYILQVMVGRNPVALWVEYECDQEMYNLAQNFDPSQKEYPTQKHLLAEIIRRLSSAQKNGKIVVSIVDNCQCIMNEREMRQLMRTGTNDAKLKIRNDRRMRWLLSGSNLGWSDRLVIIALASQHAKFDGFLETEELSSILRLSVPMDPLDLLSLKRVLSSFNTLIQNSELWKAASQALIVSGCIPRHAFNHMSSVVGGFAENTDANMLFKPEGVVVSSINANVKKYLDDAEVGSVDRNVFTERAVRFMRRILVGAAGELTKEVVDGDPVIDYGILTPLTNDKQIFRYINMLHQNVHLQQLATRCSGVDVYIPKGTDDFEAILISRILARGIKLQKGIFNGGVPCELGNLLAPEAVISISRSGGKYTSSPSDRGLLRNIIAGPSTFSVMVRCPKNYESVDVFVFCRQDSSPMCLYCIQITTSSRSDKVIEKFKNITTAVENFFHAVLEEDISLDKSKMDVTLAGPATRQNLNNKTVRVFAVLVSLSAYDSLNTGITKNRFVLLGGKDLLQEEFLVTIEQ